MTVLRFLGRNTGGIAFRVGSRVIYGGNNSEDRFATVETPEEAAFLINTGFWEISSDIDESPSPAPIVVSPEPVSSKRVPRLPRIINL